MTRRRILPRIVAGYLALSFIWMVALFLDTVFVPGATLAESAVAITALVIIPGTLGVVFVWWTWTGWKLDPQPRAMIAVAWGVAGGVVWTVLGTLLLALYQHFTLGEVGNLVGLIPSLTAPVGFVVGAVVGWVRATTRPH
jgi:membrane protease YdiL (CAAX protease family)